MFAPLILELSLAPVMAGIVWLVVIRPRKLEKEQNRAPFTERTLRPPGESLRQKIQELDDQMDEWLLWLFVPAAAAIGCAFGEGTGSGLGIRTIGFTGLAIFICLAFSFRIRVLSRERANYRLGFDGERQTAQHLIPLIADGYHVFHDIPFKDTNGKAFNIDHVVAGPTGVFAIETKTRSKKSNRKAEEVNYDGKQLHFPDFSESDSLNQIKASAKTLGKELQRRTGESIKVIPILTLPGWWINRQVNDAEVAVLNSKEIKRHINSAPQAGLNEKLFNQVIGYLEEKTEIQPGK
jgi:Nuclease-related domain